MADIDILRMTKQSLLDELHVYKKRIAEINKHMRILDKKIKRELQGQENKPNSI